MQPMNYNILKQFKVSVQELNKTDKKKKKDI